MDGGPLRERERPGRAALDRALLTRGAGQPAEKVTGYQKSGASVIMGGARITGPGTVDVTGRSLSAEHLVTATASDAVVPPIDGLDAVPVWTDREATTLTEVPNGVVMIGGSAVGVELRLFLRRFGAQVS